MSTRTNIVVLYGDTKITLYRHCDGYLSETGSDLIEKLLATGCTGEYASPDKLIRSMLTSYYDKQSYEKEPRPVYQLVDEKSGDIDHLYTIRFGRHRLEAIHHEERRLFSDGSESWTKSGMLKLDGFAKLVNQAIVEENKRLAQLKLEQPGHDWGGERPMVSLAALQTQGNA